MSVVKQARARPSLTTNPAVSSYDRLSAFLTASVIIIGFLVFLMLLIWLTMVIDIRDSSRVRPLEEMAGNFDRPEGVADDWHEPGVEDFPEVEKPQLSDALEAVTDAVSSVRAQLEEYDGNALEMGRGTGLGDIRQRGPGGGNANLIPEYKRWQIEYSASSLLEYLTQLSYFRVELGAVSQNTNRIDLVNNLTASRPDRTQTSRENEKRIYFAYNQSRLKRWDESTIAKAGVDPAGRLVVQFYNEDVRSQLRFLEQEYIQREGRTLMEVQKTIYRVRPTANGYEYFVDDVTYRQAPN